MCLEHEMGGRSNGTLQHPMGGAGWMLECCQQQPAHPKTPSLWKPRVDGVRVCVSLCVMCFYVALLLFVQASTL